MKCNKIKYNTKIGIMQGRGIPDSVNRLQVFPKEWSNELLAIEKIGFNHIELLDDKQGKFRELLTNNKKKLFKKIDESGICCVSICMDRLCNYSLLDDGNSFFKELEWLVQTLSDKNVKLVVPFCDNNKINNEFELYSCLKKFAEYDKYLSDKGIYFSLEVDLPANLIYKQLKGFNFKNIGFCYDLGNNIGRGANLYEEIMLLGKYINHIHVKDKIDGQNVQIRKNNPIMQAGFKALDKISYDGVMILETCIKPYPLKEARKNIETVKEYLRGIKEE